MFRKFDLVFTGSSPKFDGRKVARQFWMDLARRNGHIARKQFSKRWTDLVVADFAVVEDPSRKVRLGLVKESCRLVTYETFLKELCF